MNSILVNNGTQISHIPHTLMQPIVPSITVQVKTPEEQTIRYYEELIITIIKVIDIQYIIYCTDNQY